MNSPPPDTARLTSPNRPPAPPPAVDVVRVTSPDIQESWSGTPTMRSPVSSWISRTGSVVPMILERMEGLRVFPGGEVRQHSKGALKVAGRS